ncbi:hypothetical protein BDV10DRAFT_165343 [Aspergillus recurvatus]
MSVGRSIIDQSAKIGLSLSAVLAADWASVACKAESLVSGQLWASQGSLGTGKGAVRSRASWAFRNSAPAAVGFIRRTSLLWRDNHIGT